jgi:hypothetical protein
MNFGVALFRKHAVSDKSYQRAKAIFGVPAIVELGCLIGYNGMVAMTLLAHKKPRQEGAVILQGAVSA